MNAELVEERAARTRLGWIQSALVAISSFFIGLLLGPVALLVGFGLAMTLVLSFTRRREHLRTARAAIVVAFVALGLGLGLRYSTGVSSIHLEDTQPQRVQFEPTQP